MLKKAHISTILVTNHDNGEDVIRTESDGICQIEDNGILLRYPEAENNGIAILLITEALADLKRRGTTRSRLTFIEKRLLPCPYSTPHGDLDISIFTHQHHLQLNTTGGRFQARYTLLAAGHQVADNVLTVEFAFIGQS